MRLLGTRAGTLRRGARNGFVFEYDRAFLALHDAVPLSTCMPLRDEPYPPRTTERRFNGLLPEGDRRTRLARTLDVASVDTWSLLKATGPLQRLQTFCTGVH